MEYMFTEKALEKGAKALAEALHGGSWEKDYTEKQKAVWINRVKNAVQVPSLGPSY